MINKIVNVLKEKIELKDFINYMLSFIAIIISVYSYNYSKQLLDYEIQQNRLPNVTCLNQELFTKIIRDYRGEIYNYTPIEKMSFKLYNTGVGVAQNCEIFWDLKSIEDACFIAKDELLKSNIGIKDYELFKNDMPSMFYNEYVYYYDDDKLESIFYYDNEKQEIKSELIIQEIKTIPYFLPVTNKDYSIEFRLPPTIAIILLEYSNQNISKEINLILNIQFEDIVGEKYSERYLITISLKDVLITENNDNIENMECKYSLNVEKL